jgi:hypothetical protein
MAIEIKTFDDTNGTTFRRPTEEGSAPSVEGSSSTSSNKVNIAITGQSSSNNNTSNNISSQSVQILELPAGNIFVGNSINVATSVIMSGDATITNSGILTVSSNVIGNNKLAKAAAFTIKGNPTGSPANIIDMTVSQLAALLGPSVGAITELIGDVSAIGPGIATATIQPNSVSNSKLAKMATLTVKGNNTGSTANPVDLTVAQLVAMIGITSGVTTVGTIDSQTPSANGLVISGAAIYVQSASATKPGMVNTTTQSFAGSKTFLSTLLFSPDNINNIGALGGSRPKIIYIGSQAFIGPTSTAIEAQTLANDGYVVLQGDASTGSNQAAAFMGAKVIPGFATWELGFQDNSDEKSYYFGAYPGVDKGISLFNALGMGENRIFTFNFPNSTRLDMLWANDGVGDIGRLNGTGSPVNRPGNIFAFNNITAGGLLSASNFSGSSSGTNTGDVSIGTANGLSLAGQVLSLALFTPSTPGAVPLSGGGTVNFLRADGTWSPINTTNTTQVTVDFGFSGGQEGDIAKTTVAAPWVSNSSIFVCNPFAGSTPDHDPDDVIVEAINAYVENIIAGISFDVVAIAPFNSWGRYLINVVGI